MGALIMKITFKVGRLGWTIIKLAVQKRAEKLIMITLPGFVLTYVTL